MRDAKSVARLRSAERVAGTSQQQPPRLFVPLVGIYTVSLLVFFFPPRHRKHRRTRALLPQRERERAEEKDAQQQQQHLNTTQAARVSGGCCGDRRIYYMLRRGVRAVEALFFSARCCECTFGEVAAEIVYMAVRARNGRNGKIAALLRIGCDDDNESENVN